MSEEKIMQLTIDCQVALAEKQIFESKARSLETQYMFACREFMQKENFYKKEIRKLQYKNSKQLKIIADLVAQNNPIITCAPSIDITKHD